MSNPKIEGFCYTPETGIKYQLYQACALALNGAEGLGFYGVEPLQGGQLLESQGNMEIYDKSVVAKLSHLDLDTNDSFVFKMDILNDEPRMAANEIQFLRSVTPTIVQELQGQGYSIVTPVVLYDAITQERPWMIETFIEGTPVSKEYYGLEPGVLTAKHIEGICAFIKACSAFDLDRAQQNGLDLQEEDCFESFTRNLDMYGKSAVIDAIGEELYSQLSTLLTHLRPIFARQTRVLGLGDVITNNMIKISDDSLGIFDFTSLHSTNNPAYDYGYMAESLSIDPDLQSYFVRTALEMNRDVPEFKDLLWATFIYSGCINRVRRAHRDGNEAQILQCKEQIEMALSGQGAWSN